MKVLAVACVSVVVVYVGYMVVQVMTYEPVPQSSDSPPGSGPFPWGMVLNWVTCAFILGIWWLVDVALKLAGKTGLEPEEIDE